MNWRRVWFMLALVVLVAVAAGRSPATAANALQGRSLYSVRIPAVAAEDVAALGLRPERSFDYGGFQWLVLSASDYATLSDSGAPFTHVADASLVQVTRFRFDPLVNGAPSFDAAMTNSSAGPSFRLVQFFGPVQDGWLQEMQAAGLQVLQYYPHNAFLVWGTEAQAAGLETLPQVRWQGPFHHGYKINRDLDRRVGQINNIDVFFFNDGQIDETLKNLEAAGAQIIQHYPAQPDRVFYDAIITADASAVARIAQLNTVLWLGYASPAPQFDDEMSTQIVAGNHPGGVPQTGYWDHLAKLGFDGAGVIWATVDTGVDYDHPDLASRIVGGYSFPGVCAGDPGEDCPAGGHGTHVTGIIGGDATTGIVDGDGFLYGLGVAPGYSIFALNSLSASAWPPAGGWQEHSKQAVLGNAIGGNNSWTTGEGINHGYQSSERTHDLMVLDGNFDTTTVAEPFIEVFSAGNSGPGASTLTAPKEGKNLIITASSLNYRVGSIDAISSFSSRGPAVDGRWVPTIAAPGDEIASTRNDTGGSCATAIPGTSNYYAFCSGTSMAAPHTSGAIVITTEWWRSFNGGANPSAAMAKALLVNGAVDMAAADIPNIHEGWGRINITNIISSSVPVEYWDQEDVFNNTGEQVTISAGVVDPSKPLKITLAWTDAAGAVGANPALVNNLDLTVVSGGNTYHGNVFSGGWSTIGGTADSINNLENVFIQSPGGDVTIVIDAINIVGDAILYNADTTDQSFALICQNCALLPTFTLSADPNAASVCAPASADYTIDVGSILGYDDPVTLSAAGNPAGTTVNFSVNPVTPVGSSIMTANVSGATAAGDYTLTVTGTAGSDVKSIGVALQVYNSAPGAATLVSPTNGETDVSVTPTYTWTPGAQAGTYDIEIATTPGFTTLVDSATGLTSPSYESGVVLNPLTTYFWRVRTHNGCGSTLSAVSSFTTRDVPAVLLVDDDDNSPDVRSYYTTALDALGEDYDIWDTLNSDNEPDATTLSQYQMVIWFTGDEFGGAAGPGATGETALSTYLDGASFRCLFLVSQDYHYDRGLTSFMTGYLGVSGVVDDVSQTSISGVAGPFQGQSYTLSYPFTNYSDRLTVGNGGVMVFNGNQGPAVTARIDQTSTYLTMFWGAPWEGLPTADDRQNVLGPIVTKCTP